MNPIPVGARSRTQASYATTSNPLTIVARNRAKLDDTAQRMVTVLDAVNTPTDAALDESTQNWRDLARCKDRTPDMFPKEHRDITYIRQAKALCRNCPVQQDCLAYALEFPTQDMHGVWAGYTSRQLAQIQRRMGIKPTRPTIAQMWNE